MLPVGSTGLIDTTRSMRRWRCRGGRWSRSNGPIARPACVSRSPRWRQRMQGAGGLLLVDAAQMPAGADPRCARHADFVALSAHKRGGPIGDRRAAGARSRHADPSGGQERGYRPGTENLPGALGYAAALAVPEDVARYAALRRISMMP